MADDIAKEAREFVERAEAANSEERNNFYDDLHFLYDVDGQWDQEQRHKREGRPTYTFNRSVGAVNQLVGDQRQSMPQIKIRGVDDESDPEVAEVYAGLIRNIEDQSMSKAVYAQQYKYAVAGGWGAWMVKPRYRHEKSFEQDLFIEGAHNPQTVMFDPSCGDPWKKGQYQCLVAERVSRSVYEARFGEKALANLEVSRDGLDWVDEDHLRIGHYWRRVAQDIELALMSDGRVELYDKDLKALAEGGELEGIGETVQATRKSKAWVVEYHLIDGEKPLQDPITYNWRNIPIVRLPGRFINIDGEELTQSLVRHSKDAQRQYNYNRSTMAEMAANQPRNPYLVTDMMVSDKRHQRLWQTMASKNRPFLPYKHDPNVPGGPRREAPPVMSDALVKMAAMDIDDIKATNGYFDASLGAEGNETSGRHLIERQRKGDLGSYEFIDNLQIAMQITGQYLIDMIPTIYDTERVVRILREDGSEDFARVNAYDEKREAELKLDKGEYDVSVSIGPSLSTQRQETATRMLEAIGAMPILGELAADIVAKNLDVRDGDEITKRVRKVLIQKGVVEPTEEELKEIPPPQPDPAKEALIASENAKAAKNMADAQAIQTKAQTDAQMADVEFAEKVAEVLGQRLDNQFKQIELALARSGEGQMRVIVND